MPVADIKNNSSSGFINLLLLAFLFPLLMALIIAAVYVKLLYLSYVQVSQNQKNSLLQQTLTYRGVEYQNMPVYPFVSKDSSKVSIPDDDQASDYLLKQEDGRSYYVNNEYNLSYTIPSEWSMHPHKKNSGESVRGYTSFIDIVTEEGSDNICYDGMQIFRPINPDFPGNEPVVVGSVDRLKEFDRQLPGATYGNVDGYRALFHESEASPPPEMFRGMWCSTNLTRIYVELEDGTLLPIIYTSYGNANKDKFNAVVESIDFNNE